MEGNRRQSRERSFPQNPWSIIFQSWEHHYHLGPIAGLPIQPQMTINKALIILIRAIASRWPPHYLGALSQPWSQYPPWLTPSQTSHFPTAYNPAPNYASVYPWSISPRRPSHYDNRCLRLLSSVDRPWVDNVHARTLEHDLRLEAGLPPVSHEVYPTTDMLSDILTAV